MTVILDEASAARKDRALQQLTAEALEDAPKNELAA